MVEMTPCSPRRGALSPRARRRAGSGRWASARAVPSRCWGSLGVAKSGICHRLREGIPELPGRTRGPGVLPPHLAALWGLFIYLFLFFFKFFPMRLCFGSRIAARRAVRGDAGLGWSGIGS